MRPIQYLELSESEIEVSNEYESLSILDTQRQRWMMKTTYSPRIIVHN